MNTTQQMTTRPDTIRPEKEWDELFGNKRGERNARSTRARRKRKENRYAQEKRLYGK
jgi:hypothetical protein